MGLEPTKRLTELKDQFARIQKADRSLSLIGMAVSAGAALALVYALFSPDKAWEAPWQLRGLIAAMLLFAATAQLVFWYRRRFVSALWEEAAAGFWDFEGKREAAIRDPLTGLYNRRFFDELMPSEASRCERASQPLSFLLIDVEGFRDLNRSLGNLACDQLLRTVAAVLKGSLRTSDLLFRFGGDEFVIALPGTPLAGAEVLKSRIQRKIGAEPAIRKLIGSELSTKAVCALHEPGTAMEHVIDSAAALLARTP